MMIKKTAKTVVSGKKEPNRSYSSFKSGRKKTTVKTKSVSSYSYYSSGASISATTKPKAIAKKQYISANSTRYKARFRREGIRYAQKKRLA